MSHHNLTRIFQLPGEAGIIQTVSIMKDLVNRSFYLPEIRDRAAQLTVGCSRYIPCEHSQLLGWVRGRVSYLRDPEGVEAIFTPMNLEERLRENSIAYGDCDDMATYLATLLKAIGHKPRFRVMGRKMTLHHVAIICEGETLDPTLNEAPRNPGRAIQFPI